MSKNGFLSIVVLFCCFFSAAQDLQIVRDPVLCNYGLKDAGGKWITQPSFTEITSLQNNTFRTYDGLVYGLLGSSGQLLVAPEFDQVDYRHDCDCYFVRKNDKQGVLALNGEIRIPTDYSFVKYFRDFKQFLVHQKAGDSTVSFFLDQLGNSVAGPFSGAFLPRPINGYWSDESELPMTRWIVAQGYWPTQRENYEIVTGPYGVMDSKGRVLLPMIYDDVKLRKDGSFWVIKSGKLGMVNQNGKTIVEPVYYPELLHTNSSSVVFPTSNKPAVVRNEEGQFGLMNEYGRIILPVAFMSIQRTQKPELLEKKLFYLLEKSGKYGYCNDMCELIIPLSYDSLIPFYYNRKLSNGSNEQKLLAFIAQNNDEYGVIDLNGDTLVAIQYCDWLHLKEQKSYLLERDQRMYSIVVSAGVIKLEELHESGGVDQYRFFRINDQVIPFEKAGNEWKVAVYTEHKKPIQLLRFPDKKNSWYDETGKQIGSYSYLTPLTDRLLLVQTVKHKRGVIRFPEQTFVMDTVYRSLNLGYGYLWATPFEEDAAFCWQPYDMEGRKLSETCFSEYFTIGDTIVVKSGGKLGVVKPDLSWLIPPDYKLLVKFGSSSWLVKGMNGGIGAIDVNGKRIADTVYTEIEPVYARHYTDTTAIFPPGEWWLLKRSSDSLLISSTGETISTLKQRKLVLKYLDEAILKPQMLYGALNMPFHDEKSRAIVLQSSYKQRLIGEYRKRVKNTNRCNDFSRADHYFNGQQECSHSSDRFLVIGAGNKFYTYAIVSCFTHYSMEEPGATECDYAYTNNVFYNGRWKELHLYDVFGKGDALLQKELQRAIQQLKDEHVPCYDPDQLVRSVQGFYLSAEGVRISVSLGDYEKTLLIPKSRLSALTTSKWIVPLLN